MRWLRASFVPVLGVLLLLMVVLTYAQFSYQQGRVAQAVRCQNGLLQLVVARGNASNDERTALRALVLGFKDGVSAEDASNFTGYEYAIARADQVYQSNGSLVSAQTQCSDTG